MDDKNSLHPLFYPRGIAVVGVSRKVDAIGSKIFRALLASGFPGPVHPVNPSLDRAENRRVFACVSAAPRPVDLAVLAVPASRILDVVDDCAKAGVKALVVITAGFGETGEAGKKIESELTRKVRAAGMRMVGPNCFGVLNTDPASPMSVCFSSVFARSGGTAMASQSGAMGLAILNMARQHQTGLSMFVSMGNKADVSSNDLIEYWEHDPRTNTILLYLESFGNPGKFAGIARRVGKKKPIIALKSGRSNSGARAAGSHTAALAANDTAVDALFRQSGVLRVSTVDEMFQVAMAAETQPLPDGNRVAVLTNAGGPAILCADACEAANLSLPELKQEIQTKLRTFIPSAASSKNPVDLVASATPDIYAKAIEAILVDPNIDALIVIFAVIDGIPADLQPCIGKAIHDARLQGCSKPVYFCLMEGEVVHPPLKTPSGSIPVFGFPEEAARALGQLARYVEWRNRPLVVQPSRPGLQLGEKAIPAAKAGEKERWLSPTELDALLGDAGIRYLPVVSAATADAAVARAAGLGHPVAMKIVSSRLTHKTDIGGVLLNLKDAVAVRTGFETIRNNLRINAPGTPFEGVALQAMAPKGAELFIGMTRDPVFGPLIGFGLGGVFVEVLRDLSFRLAPLSAGDAEEMLAEIRASKILDGYRGMPGVDKEAIVDLLLRVSEISLAYPRILSFDFNPVLGLSRGCVVVDARAQIGP